MSEILTFKVDGKISPNHRAQWVRNKRTGKMIIHGRKDYQQSQERIKSKVGIIAYDLGLKRQRAGIPIKVYLHFLLCGRIKVCPRGRRPYIKRRQLPDEDNLVKAMKDALQGILYENDKDVLALPFPERYGDRNPWMTVLPGHPDEVKDYTEVGIEVLEPTAEEKPQTDLNLDEGEC